jgi:DNA-binding transcriptional ArsR family regulator
MDAFTAIAEPNRRRILDLLREGERPAGDVVEALSISQPGVSKHLRLLREAGLVRSRVDGQRRLYSVEPRQLASIESWLRPHLDFWRGRLDDLERHLDREG